MGVEKGTGRKTERKQEIQMDKPDPNMQIRKLPYRIHRELSKLLDISGDKDWKALVAVLPDGMFTSKQVKVLEGVGRSNGSPADELLRDLGYQLTTVKQLIGYLTKLNHQEALLLLKPLEPVQITKQPTSISVYEGESVILTCGAKGFPKPCYQWVKEGQGDVETGIEKALHFKSIDLEDAGDYFCQVSNEVNTVSSNVVGIEVIPTDNKQFHSVNRIAQVDNGRSRSCPSTNPPRNDALEPREVYPGQYFVLSCGVDDLPNVNYYWLKNGNEIPGENGPKLIFNPFGPKDEGFYSCRVVGEEGDMLTKLMHLKVGNAALEDRQVATGKVALIIGNQHYICKRPPNLELVHPVDDARTLGAVLREMGYRVICLVDLDKEEMLKAIKGFCEMLVMSPGMYGLFYFGGHGYEENGRTYLVPVDSPSSWNVEYTICADEVLSQMQHSKTKLNVLILDVCRTPSRNDSSSNSAKSFDPYLIPGSQSVICYATCPQSQAYERRSDHNGIYMKHLIRHIHNDKRIENVIFDVHRDVSRETEQSVLTKNMSPTYNSSTTKEFRLLDPVAHDLSGDPTAKWFQHHRLPSSQILTFENGIKTKLCFDSICSNLCYLILHVEDTGSTSECDIGLLEISKDIKMDENYMNISSNISFDLLARSNPDVQHPKGKALPFERRTKLSNLQKITGKVMLTLEAAYKVNEKERRENKCIIIDGSEFGITSLFHNKQ